METMPEIDPAARNEKGRFPLFVFLVQFLPMAILVLVIGISLAAMRTEARIKEVLDLDSTRLHLVSGFLGAEVLGSLKHLRSLATEAVTRQALDSQAPAQLQSLEASFLILARRNPQYQQIRWIDESGVEKVRIMRDQGEFYVVPPQDLQDKSSSRSFEEASALLPGELYISRIDLNEENGQIEMPPRPMLRIATPVEDSDRKSRGIVIINIEVKYLFNLVRGPEQTDEGAEYFLVNQQGTLLNGDVENLQSVDAPGNSVDFALSHQGVWEKVSVSDSGSLELPDGLWTWEELSPADTFKQLKRVFPQHLATFDHLIANDFSLTMMVHRPPATLEDIRRENRMLISLGAIFILAVYGLSLYFYLNSHARARRAELDAAYARARASGMERMKELEERFRCLVEASSIGQLVVDGAGRIEISNPAAERMLGYERGELEGLGVDTLLPIGLQEKHVHLREQFMQAPEARQMGVERELEAVRKDGSTIPVEVGLNPYTDRDRPLILASIIDLSQRGEKGR